MVFIDHPFFVQAIRIQIPQAQYAYPLSITQMTTHSKYQLNFLTVEYPGNPENLTHHFKSNKE